MKLSKTIPTLAVALLLATPLLAADGGPRARDDAQRGRANHGKQRAERVERGPQARGPVYRYPDTYRDRGRGKGVKAKGPAFCRSGAGHPVFGRQWCIDKGFGLGYGDRRGVLVDDGPLVILRLPIPLDRRRGSFGLPRLGDVLGGPGLSRLAAALLGGSRGGPVNGRWLDSRDGAWVLQLQSREHAARLIDQNRDGYVDLVLIDGD